MKSNTNRFKSEIIYGKTKKGTPYFRNYGISSNGFKWNKTEFENRVRIKSGKNKGKYATVVNIVEKSNKIYFPK